MFRALLAVTISSIALLGSQAALAAPPVYYAIELADQPIGYSSITSREVELDGRKLLSVNSQTTLKVAVLGAERLVVRRSQTFFDRDTHLPVSFRVDTDTNGQIGHVESEFKDGKVSTWAYADGEEKGDPVVTELAENTYVLGSNNFAHWGIVLKRGIEQAKNGSTVIAVYLPDTKQVTQFALKKGESASIEVLGKPRACDKWNLEGSGVTVCADSTTKQLVVMEILAQKTTIKLADDSVVQALESAGPQEMLAQNFVQSNVNFDDMLKVTQVKADIDVAVFGSGPGNEPTVLTTAMQQFDGEKKEAKILGSVTVRSTLYQGERSPAFPTRGETPEDLGLWVQPSTMIESDHPDIMALGNELTEGATTRWDAVKQVATWVNKEIKYAIADSPSARLALERRKGDCGPHSTLMVAILRSVRIPAKLVGGVVYTPSFGGTFGQHAWVEVHMGDSGWVSLDPTTGEYEQVSATHIKLFEGMGGVVPSTIKVVEYEPKNRELSAEHPAAARPWSWKLGEEHTYRFTKAGNTIGDEKFRFQKIEVDNQQAYQLTDTLRLADGPVEVKSTTKLVVKPNAAPISYHRELGAAGKKYTFACEFEGDVVRAKVTGDANMTRDIKLKPTDLCFDNNLIGSFAAICTQLDLEPGKTVNVRTYHPSSMQIIPLEFKCESVEKLTFSGEEVECFKCLVGPIQNNFWIARDGRLLKVAQGPLVIELVK